MENVLTGADQSSGRSARVIAAGFKFDGDGGDVVEHTRLQISQNVCGPLPVQVVCFRDAGAQGSVGNGKHADHTL